jgi:hypothetical protein
MHDIEPYYGWRDYYIASDDPSSIFFDRQYSEFEFTQKIYDHYIHPQWDSMDSQTLFLKILFVEYEEQYAIIELIGEWNDLLYNDIMLLKREVADHLIHHGINKFILIGENVLNFHASDDCYYEEWFEDVQDEEGWICLLNFRDHVLKDISAANIDHFFLTGGQLQEMNWRTYRPEVLFEKIRQQVQKRLG